MNYGNYYRINEKKICLYGYGDRAINLEKKLSNVICIVDRNASAIKKEILITKELFFEKTSDEKDKWCIIICLQNAIGHKDVAAMFHDNGYNNVIYIDVTDNCDSTHNRNMRAVYSELLYSSNLDDILAPDYNAVNAHADLLERFVIKKYDQYIVFWCPLELVYVDNLKASALTEERWQFYKKYYDANITQFKPYSDLYDYLGGKTIDYNSLSSYFELIGKPFSENSFNDRKQLYNSLLWKMKYDPTYFIDTPSYAEWNPKGYFNMKDGHNRCTFLYKNGFEKIPMIVGIIDYEKSKEKLLERYAQGKNEKA